MKKVFILFVFIFIASCSSAPSKDSSISIHSKDSHLSAATDMKPLSEPSGVKWLQKEPFTLWDRGLEQARFSLGKSARVYSRQRLRNWNFTKPEIYYDYDKRQLRIKVIAMPHKVMEHDCIESLKLVRKNIFHPRFTSPDMSIMSEQEKAVFIVKEWFAHHSFESNTAPAGLYEEIANSTYIDLDIYYDNKTMDICRIPLASENATVIADKVSIDEINKVNKDKPELNGKYFKPYRYPEEAVRRDKKNKRELADLNKELQEQRESRRKAYEKRKAEREKRLESYKRKPVKKLSEHDHLCQAKKMSKEQRMEFKKKVMQIFDAQKRVKGDISDEDIQKMNQSLEKNWEKADAEDCE